MNVFDQIYGANIWGCGSGHGSLPSVTKGYRRFLEDFLKTKRIKSVVDFGCGDWQFSRLIKWGDVKYVGLDVVPAVIERNNKKFASNTVSFRSIAGFSDLPQAELLIVKDVLQHLQTDDIKAFLETVVPNYPYALITNCVTPVGILNREINNGDFRPLDLRKPPFEVDAEEVFSFRVPRRWLWRKWEFLMGSTKIVLLIDNHG
jgi:SAM-dependent methyltransferase